MYIELHTASAFSFLQGASLPEAIVERAANLGYDAVALLDRDGVYGAPRFYKAARAAGIKAIVGAELTLADAATNPSSDSRLRHGFGEVSPELAAEEEASERRRTSPSRRSAQREGGQTWLLPVLVASRDGYQNLCRLVTRMKLRAPKGEGALTLDDLDGSVGGLVAIAGRQLLRPRDHGVGGLLDRLNGIFGRDHVYVELQRHFDREEEVDNESLIDLAQAYRVPLLVTNGVRFSQPDERPLFDIFTCLHQKTTLAAAGRRLVSNAERYLKSPEAIAGLFADQPAAVAATRALADRLEYTMADLGYRFPEYPVPPGETMIAFLRRITQVGARDRYRPLHDRARAQIARELDLIEKLDLAGYFLIVWDLVNFCRQHGVLVQGRGSAANSAVCYSLGITAVDPVKMDLLFERFLSEERGEWPDIDLDLPSGDRREQVIQYVYERYGKLGAAMTANVITYRSRSATREIGKVLGFDEAFVDRLARLMNRFEYTDSRDTLGRHLKEAGVDPTDPRIRQFGDLWHRMQDLPRHLGQHSGGMVICQGRLDSVVPLENATMPGRVVVQWDKEDCADLGLIKVDLLGLGMMAVLQDALAMVNKGTVPLTNHGGLSPTVDLAHLPEDDRVYQMLQEADTVGLFQVESRAQMATLPRLKPKVFYDLVVQVAIIRPGPIVGQMVHPYLNRRAGREPVVYPHPSLEPILARTLGVPLFQEQLLRMAMVAAGFSGGQAEELRRAMGFKRSEKRMRVIEQQLREGMARRGITGDAAEQIITSIASFALYGFPESHAASFALLAYASAYLKVHYPAAFFASLLNNQPMGFYHPATLVKDAQRHGVHFTPIDVEISDWDCTIEADGRVRLGLRYVSGLREPVGRAMAAAAIRSPSPPALCPKCGCDDRSLLECVADQRTAAPPHCGTAAPPHCGTAALPHGSTVLSWSCFCNLCAHDWTSPRAQPRKFASIEDLIRRTGVRRDELAVLAEVGALASFGHDRRGALWQIEHAVRPSGELFDESGRDTRTPDSGGTSPLAAMTPVERMAADFAGTGMTIGPHPMTFHRSQMALKGVLRTIDLPRQRPGRRVRVAGCIITRQRPGTAKGFVFLTLEDETGIGNVIITPDVYDEQRLVVVDAAFVIVEGILQHQDGVTAVKAERLSVLQGLPVTIESHDFH
jgi:error-prone DNA polymerase